MKLALVVAGGVDRSGRERVVPTLLWLIERLARTHEVHVFVLRYHREPSTYPLLGASIHDLGHSGLPGVWRFDMPRRLQAAMVRQGPFDVLHAYWGLPPGWVATRVARRLGVPTVVTLTTGELVAIEDIGYGLQRRWLDRRAIAATIRDASRLTVDTEYMAALPALGGVRPLVLPLGVDASLFPAAARVDGPPWRLLRVGSLNLVKDYPTLLRAMMQLVAGGLDIHLDIVGEDTCAGATQALALELGLAASVTFHGWLPTERVAALYQRAHLHIVSSRHEASSYVMLEAACTGLPTVGTAVGYVADWAPDRAVAVPVGRPERLADAIGDLLHDSPRREQIGRAARAWALAHDADRSAAALAALYADLMQRGRQAPR